MESMTGYGSCEKKGPQFTVSVSVKSLNSRYFEMFFNINRALQSEEQQYAELVKEAFDRGKVEVNVEIGSWTSSRGAAVNAEVLVDYYRQLDNVRSRLGLDEQTLSLDSLLTLDGVMQRERTVISDESRKLVLATMKEALAQVGKMRLREGKAVQKDIMQSHAGIVAAVKKITVLSKKSAARQFERLKERVAKLADMPDQNRMYAELAMISDRVDINEELSRLQDHLLKFTSTAKESGQIGKRLDFIAQEMFREINTIGSKTNDSEISHLCVEAKNYIEKIREQCRNIV